VSVEDAERRCAMLTATNTRFRVVETHSAFDSSVESQMEKTRRSPKSLLFLWLVSYLAAFTNIAKAVFRKVLNPSKPFRVILWEMGRSEKHVSSWFVDKFSQLNHRAKVGSAGWKSLDIFYNYQEKFVPQLKENMEGFLTDFWMNIENRQAVRNRLKIVVRALEDAFVELSGKHKEVRILSIASGSAQAVIDAMKAVPWIKVKAVLIDMDESALDYAKKQAEKAGFLDRFTFVQGKTTLIEEEAKKLQPHIIEMVGFLDYRTDGQAVDLFRRIKNQLPADGFFLTCNINKNPEKPFLDWVLLWPMIYRTKEDVARLLKEGGFEKQDVFYEPLGVHSIGVCRA